MDLHGPTSLRSIHCAVFETKSFQTELSPLPPPPAPQNSSTVGRLAGVRSTHHSRERGTQARRRPFLLPGRLEDTQCHWTQESPLKCSHFYGRNSGVSGTAKETQEARGSCVLGWKLRGPDLHTGGAKAREWPQVTRRPVRLCRTSAVDGVLSCEPLLLGKCAFSCPGHAARSHGLGSAMSHGGDSITRPESRVHNPKAPRSCKATGGTTHPQAEPWCCRGPSGVQGRGS